MDLKHLIDRLLEKSSSTANSFIGWCLQSRRMIAIGAAFVFGLSLLLLWISFAQPFSSSASSPIAPPSPEPPVVKTFARALDGVFLDSASGTQLLPLAVMVENSADAWPLSGPAKANVVIEAPVEGSITRFMLLFDPTNPAQTIGPVRSARPYYVDFADAIGALYAHVGGSPDALAKIHRLDRIHDLDQFFHDSYFERVSYRYAPHNVYTSVAELADAASDQSWSPVDFRSWTYLPETETTSSDAETDADVLTIEVPYEGAYAAHWEYDTETNQHTRFQNEHVQKDADGTIVTASNVVVMTTDIRVLDEKGRLSLQTEGRGNARIYHSGKRFAGYWVRSRGEHLRFETIDGKDIPLARGVTWISILSSSTSLE